MRWRCNVYGFRDPRLPIEKRRITNLIIRLVIRRYLARKKNWIPGLGPISIYIQKKLLLNFIRENYLLESNINKVIEIKYILFICN